MRSALSGLCGLLGNPPVAAIGVRLEKSRPHQIVEHAFTHCRVDPAESPNLFRPQDHVWHLQKFCADALECLLVWKCLHMAQRS